MVSEFRRKKYMEVFNYYDTKKNGAIDKDGFELAIKEISKVLGWQAGDAKYKEVQDTLLKIWDGITKEAGSDKVTADKWVSMWNNFANNPLEWQNSYSKFNFWLLDSDNDGTVGKEEFSSINAAFGTDKAETDAVFDKLSKGKGVLTWQDYQELWKEYFSSDDPNAVGNYIFVKTSF